jgi:aminoglycoside phosphotransferase (APT) family kinase protein
VTFRPTFDSWEEFRAHRFEEPLWRPLVQEVLVRHDIEPPERVAMASSVHVVAIAGPVVVKLYQPLSERDAWAIESAAIRLLGRHGLPVPKLLATGVLFPRAPRFQWPYCILGTLAGRPLDDMPITAADRQRMAAFLGRFLRGMHRIQPPAGQFEAPGFLAERLSTCVQEHRRRDILPGHLLDQLDRFLAATRPIVLDGRPPVLTHGDLHAGNVYVDGLPGHTRPIGVLDFNDVRLLDPHYDLVVVHLRALDGDTSLLRRLLDAYAWGQPGPRWPQRMLALSLAHDFDEVGALFQRDATWRSVTSLDDLARRLWALSRPPETPIA